MRNLNEYLNEITTSEPKVDIDVLFDEWNKIVKYREWNTWADNVLKLKMSGDALDDFISKSQSPSSSDYEKFISDVRLALKGVKKQGI